MLILKALLLGALAGVAEFFPVSGSGHIALLGNALGFETDLSFMIMLHAGAMISVIWYFRAELIKILKEVPGLLRDSLYNLRQLLSHAGDVAEVSFYRKAISNTYRKILVMLMISTAVLIAAGTLFFPAAETISAGILGAGMGLIITSLVLIVASFSKAGRRGPKEARLSDALVIGAFEAGAIIPGVSRLAMTYSSGLFSGFSKKFSRLFSFYLLIPAVIGAFLFDNVNNGWTAPSCGWAAAIFGMVSAMVVGYFAIGFAIKLFGKIPLRAFSIYCLIMGIISVFCYLL